MTVSQQINKGKMAWTGRWGPERCVEIRRSSNSNLGFSIVGGKVEIETAGSNVLEETNGIFVKNVDITSPAGTMGQLKVGDRILEVNGSNLQNTTYENAVEKIKNTGNSVKLTVQSFMISEDNRYSKDPELPVTVDTNTGQANDDNVNSERCINSNDNAELPKLQSSIPNKNEIISNEKKNDDDKQEAKITNVDKTDESDESSDEEDERMLEGNIMTKAGEEISRRSAGNVKRSADEIKADPETEDEFGYTLQKVKKKYAHLGSEVVFVKLEREGRNIGLTLAGHRERTKMSVFISGINPKRRISQSNQLKVGDEILEVNGQFLFGRCHLNASAIIKKLPHPNIKMVVFRNASGIENLAMRPVTYFPDYLNEHEEFSQFEGVRTLNVNKGTHGLGIMIIQGKHAKVGEGIFISDIQEGSAAEKAGIHVGDMILAVNSDSLLDASYEQATQLLKKVEGVVALTVCNVNVKKEEPKPSPKKLEEPNYGPFEPSSPNYMPNSENSKPKTAEISPPPPLSRSPTPVPQDSKKPITIEFTRPRGTPLGFHIVGGSDTPYKNIFVLDVMNGGAIGNDKLKRGDQILEYNSEKFKSTNYESAKSAVLNPSGNIKMVILRNCTTTEQVEVALYKKAGKGFGMHLTGFSDGKGVYISELVPGGSARESKDLYFGDHLVDIYGQDVSEMSLEDVTLMLKMTDPAGLKIARYKATEAI